MRVLWRLRSWRYQRCRIAISRAGGQTLGWSAQKKGRGSDEPDKPVQASRFSGSIARGLTTTGGSIGTESTSDTPIVVGISPFELFLPLKPSLGLAPPVDPPSPASSTTGRMCPPDPDARSALAERFVLSTRSGTACSAAGLVFSACFIARSTVFSAGLRGWRSE